MIVFVYIENMLYNIVKNNTWQDYVLNEENERKNLNLWYINEEEKNLRENLIPPIPTT